ncbi:condensation domain-containing protein [Kitasatospora viridis]|uniref:Condensation domain-containing protein n=1 Tax=Kitasatospora viridis TaxID=281105 RepID=A0A561UPU4_9ACTN|nr:condensation domain-containing protein [Kitasatospora viridis]TWG01361.1 condensation domain-containing protein [Kitasatospora viridis]
MSAGQRITVRYRAAGPGGDAPLTLGQDNMVRCVLRDEPAHMSKQALWPVPPGTGLPAALGALRTLAERHPALRTVFPGTHFESQRELLEGEFTVAVEPVPTAAEVDAYGERLGWRERQRAFDLARDFPLRCTLLTVAGAPVRLLVVVCHAQLDGAATALLFQEWLRLAAGESLPPVTAIGPREVAEQERSVVGRRRAAAALKHWERVLREDPLAVFADDRVTRSDAQLPTLIVRSLAGAKDLARAVERTGASTSTLLLTAYAALVARLADQRTLVVSALSGNRHRRTLADHIGTLAQDALISLTVPLDEPALDLDELARRTQAAALAGYWHSTFDAEAVWQLIEDAALRRGARYPRHVVLNDLSATIPESAARARPLPAAEPEFGWLPAETIPTRVMLNIWRVDGVLELSLHLDPVLFPREQAEGLARLLLRLLALIAERPVALGELTGLAELAGLRPGRRERPGWRRVDGSWIDLAAVRELVAGALGLPCRIELPEGGPLTAVLAERPGEPLTPERAHRAVVAALPEHHTAMAPQLYRMQLDGRTLREGSGR